MNDNDEEPPADLDLDFDALAYWDRMLPACTTTYPDNDGFCNIDLPPPKNKKDKRIFGRGFYITDHYNIKSMPHPSLPYKKAKTLRGIKHV